MTKHIVNISGGKDSAACYMLAIQRGRPFRAVTADTGHENPITYDWIRSLPARTGGPVVEVARYDFTDKIAHKRKYVEEKWPDKGVSDEIIETALSVLHPTGNPFIDLCIWKGRFPSRRAQFCTEWLKAEAIFQQFFKPIQESEPVVSWQGERRDESLNRRHLPKFQTVRLTGLHKKLIYRPILEWSAADTFDLHRRFGLEPNPLYKLGMSRVGCFPCVNAKKGELKQIFSRFPETLVALRDMEILVSKASKRQQATIFASSATPQGAALAKAQKRGERLNERFPSIYDMAEWAKTSRGGEQYDGLSLMEDDTGCSSEYGLCE